MGLDTNGHGGIRETQLDEGIRPFGGSPVKRLRRSCRPFCWIGTRERTPPRPVDACPCRDPSKVLSVLYPDARCLRDRSSIFFRTLQMISKGHCRAQRSS